MAQLKTFVWCYYLPFDYYEMQIKPFLKKIKIKFQNSNLSLLLLVEYPVAASKHLFK